MSAPGEALQDLFERARALPSEARARLLDELDRVDPPRAAALRRLLAAAAAGDSPLDAGPWALLDAEDESAPPPERIGPYRVIAEIGRGGMGRVYLALQRGDGFERRLAVKVVAPDGSGPEIARRFRTERQILAGLEHPGIARFHDAGRGDAGNWFLALEYVEGENLIDHAAARSLGVAERLRLFVGVLDAVAYAHARGIVHRDLKPANVLVDAGGRPRLLDFGIAKLLDDETAAATRTRTALRALTPAYASPEQFRGEPVRPASDVFSLGVVLYELLAGVRPFGAAGGSAAALERDVLDTDPEPPSTASRRATAGTAGAEPAPVGGRLPRDLDAICLKALRKEPDERYPDAAALAADLERHLAGLPVAARGDDLRYRAGRFLRRRRAALAVAAALLVAAGAIGVAITARRGSPAPVAAEPAPQPFPFSGITAAEVPELERRFAAAPASIEAGARLALALERGARHDEALLIVARLRQIPGRELDPLVDYVEATVAAGSDQPQRALVLFATAIERAVAGGRGELVAQIRAARGRLLFTLGRRDEARTEMESARRSFAATNDAASLSRVLNDLAIDDLAHGRLAAGEELLEQALAAGAAAGGGGPGIITLNLGEVALQRGRPDRAETRMREAVAAFTASRSRMLPWARTTLAGALRDLGRPLEAAAELDAALTLIEKTATGRGQAFALALGGTLALDAGALEDAAAAADALEAQAKRSGDRTALGLANRLRGELAAARGDAGEARRRLDDARRQLADNAEGDFVAETDLVRAELELAAGETAAARAAVAAIRPTFAAAIETTTQFLAEAVRVRLDAAAGDRAAARRGLAKLEAVADGTTSVRRQLALARARAAIAAADGRQDDAAEILRGAASLARSTGFGVEAAAIERQLSISSQALSRAIPGRRRRPPG